MKKMINFVKDTKAVVDKADDNDVIFTTDSHEIYVGKQLYGVSKESIGDMRTLNTNSKDNLVDAINELYNTIRSIVDGQH